MPQTRAAKRQRGAISASAAMLPAPSSLACCSRAIHGDGQFLEQRFYECLTCDMTLDKGIGICRGCRLRCHAGHEVSFLGLIKAYCDCQCAGTIDSDASQSDCSDEEGEEDTDPRLSRSYGSKAYWDQRYEGNAAGEEGDEWLVGYGELEHVIRPHLEGLESRAKPDRRDVKGGRRKASISAGPRMLMLGCGDSSFSADVYNAGFENLVNIDFSAVCIDKMTAANRKTHPNMSFLTADATELPSHFDDDTFDCVLDKTLLDSLCCSEDAASLVPAMLEGGQSATRFARIENVGEYQSCMVSKLRIVWKQTVVPARSLTPRSQRMTG